MQIINIINEFIPFFIAPIFILIIRCVLNIAKAIAKGEYQIEREKRKEITKEQKINIDKDLQKYFDYKEN